MPTNLKITNSSSDPVDLYFWLADSSQVKIEDLSFITNVIETGIKGSFTLGKGQSVTYTGKDNVKLQGNFAANSLASNCPDRTSFPNGINLFEFAINMAPGNFQAETIDISCVAGVNAHYQFTLPGDLWTYNNGTIKATGGENLQLNKNTGQQGVFPYGCDDCIRRLNPPSKQCTQPNVPPITCEPQSDRICQAMRQAGNSTGTVEVDFKGLYS